MTQIHSWIAPDLRGLAVPIDDLSFMQGNPRLGDVPSVARSYAVFGQRKPIVAVRLPDGGTFVSAGNHQLSACRLLAGIAGRLQAARFEKDRVAASRIEADVRESFGDLAFERFSGHVDTALATDGVVPFSTIAVTWIEEDAVSAKAFALADNRTSELGDSDPQLLLDMLGEVESANAALLPGTAFAGSDLADLLALVSAATPDPSELLPDVDPDDVPDDAPAITKPGDVWVIGPHRVICGDSTDPAVYELLLAGAKADMVWTDPPYGVAIVGGSHELQPEDRLAAGGKTIENDALDADGLGALLDAALGAAAQSCTPGAGWFVAAPPGPLFGVFGVVLTRLGIWRQTISWVKDSLVLGRSDYHYRHEAVFYGWVPGAAHTEPPDRTQDTVWEIPRPKRSTVHPTMKPVELVARAVRNHTKPGAVILDPFGGAGTTLIAAHQEGRVCRLIELAPGYVDVICKRAQQATGIRPILEATGRPVDFLNEGEAG